MCWKCKKARRSKLSATVFKCSSVVCLMWFKDVLKGRYTILYYMLYVIPVTLTVLYQPLALRHLQHKNNTAWSSCRHFAVLVLSILLIVSGNNPRGCVWCEFVCSRRTVCTSSSWTVSRLCSWSGHRLQQVLRHPDRRRQWHLLATAGIT